MRCLELPADGPKLCTEAHKLSLSSLDVGAEPRRFRTDQARASLDERGFPGRVNGLGLRVAIGVGSRTFRTMWRHFGYGSS